MIVFNIIIGLLVTCVVAFCYIIMISFTVWMMIDAGKQDRFWWLTVIIGVPVIGAAAYYFTEKKHEYRQAPVHYVHASETEQQHEKAPKKKSVRKAKSVAETATEKLIVTEKIEEKTEEVKEENKDSVANPSL